jgi:DnaK suppressor protein
LRKKFVFFIFRPEKIKFQIIKPGSPENMTVMLPPDYKPLTKEPFMNKKMLEFFRQKLLNWKTELLSESNSTIQILQEGGNSQSDLGDRASVETNRSIELRTRDRARKLTTKIDEALERIENGSYGYCVETNEPISISRLEARPIATLSIEAQERHERMEKTQRDE